MSWATDSQAIYLAARYAIDSLTRDDESVTIKRMGVVAGISLKLWKFYIRPELGYETVIGYGSIRTGGLGFGLEDMQLF